MTTTIRILQGIGGPDFSWAPGDLVDLADEEAARWADGQRAELADRVEPDPEQAPAMVQQQPKVVDEDGQELDVLAATLEHIEAPDGIGDQTRWVQWSVTVRLPALPTPDIPAGGEAFDPADHSVKDVLAYLEDAGEEEAMRVLQSEENAPMPRKGIVSERDAILTRARARATGQGGAETTAEASRGGGRGDGIETR